MRRTTFGTVKGDSLSINALASNNCFVTETSSKIAPVLSQNWLIIFPKKSQNFAYFVTKGLKLKLKLVKCPGPVSFAVLYNREKNPEGVVTSSPSLEQC